MQQAVSGSQPDAAIRVGGDGHEAAFRPGALEWRLEGGEFFRLEVEMHKTARLGRKPKCAVSGDVAEQCIRGRLSRDRSSALLGIIVPETAVGKIVHAV